MGRIVTPTYRAELTANTPFSGPFAWDCKVNGRPTNTNAENFRTTYNDSFRPGGVNFHVSEARGVIVHISRVRVVRQSTGEVVAEAVAPMFEVA